MDSTLSAPESASTRTVSGDWMILAALVAGAVVSVAIGNHYGGLLLAMVVSACLVVLGTAACTLGQGSLGSRLVLALCLGSMVVLHIHLGRGTLEFHFGVFVTLALLLVYLDWRPIIALAGFYAVHHVLFDRLQAAGFAVYCTPEPNFLKMVMHAGYVVIQTAMEVFIAVALGRLHREGEEMSRLVDAIGRDGRVNLDLSRVAVASAGARQLKATVERLHAAMDDVHATAEQIRRASTDIASGTRDLSDRNEQTATSLQQTASAMEQLSGALQQSAGSADQANRLSTSAAAVAGRGGDMVAQVVATMDEINASSKQIADITSVIDGIAFQTNILALNAAVEAARAGEQGRGFAVVASEVRSLAQRSAKAAREIKVLIGASAERVEAGARLVAATGGTMKDIVDSVQRVSGSIGEITSASDRQAKGMGQVSGAVQDLDHMTQQNAALVGQSTSAAESLRQHAARLSEVVGNFRLRTA